MTKNNTLLMIGFVFLSIFVISCNDDGDDGPDSQPSTGDYFPTTINNEWNYDDGSVMDITGMTEIGGNTYYDLGNFAGTTQSGAQAGGTYKVRKDGGDYYLRLETSVNNGAYIYSHQPIDLIILKDYMSVGETFSQAVTFTYTYEPLDPSYPDLPSTSITGQYNYEIKQVGASVESGGEMFQNVIEVELTYSSNGQSVVSSTFYAKDVGLIKSINDAGSGEIEITSYTLF